MSFRFWSWLFGILTVSFLGLSWLQSLAARFALHGFGLHPLIVMWARIAWPVCLLGLLALVLARLWGGAAPRDRVKKLQEADAFRMLPVLLVALFFLAWVGLYAPGQLVVLCFKPGSVFLGGYLGYWAFRQLLPFFRPSGFLARPWRESLKSGFVNDGPNFEVAPGQMIPFLVSVCLQGLFVIGGMLAVGMAL